jgi:hypothetical protein
VSATLELSCCNGTRSFQWARRILLRLLGEWGGFHSSPDIFSGNGVSNTWREKVLDRPCDHKLGHGDVLMSPEDGLSAVLFWVHIDGFLIHGPTYEKTARAMQALIDKKALDIGLLFNLTKTTPPTGAIKYCGFIYGTKHIPSLQISTDKRLRSLVLLKYVMDRSGQEMSRLALPILYDVLQALVPATPANLGTPFCGSGLQQRLRTGGYLLLHGRFG